MTDLLTISRMKAGRSCLRYHKYRYLDGYRPAIESDDLRFGSLFHVGLETWMNAVRAMQCGVDQADPLVEATVAVRKAEAHDAFDLVKAEELLAGYHFRWLDEQLEVLAVEKEFEGPLVNPLTGKESIIWRRGGKVDAIVRHPDGRVLVVEHKTSSEDIAQGSDYWRRLRIDGQVSSYHEGARFLGYDIAGCLYDVIGKPGIRPLKATPVDSRKFTKDGRLYSNQRDKDETPEEYRRRLAEDIAENPAKYYQREIVVRLEEEMQEALLDDWHFGQVLRETIRLGRAPRNPDACVRWGKTCEFFDVCTGVASLEDPARFRRVDNVHPELTLHLLPKEEAAPCNPQPQ